MACVQGLHDAGVLSPNMYTDRKGKRVEVAKATGDVHSGSEGHRGCA